MKNENIKDIIAENRRRTARLADNYDPISGQGCLGERITVRRRGGKDVLVPATMTADPSYRKQMSAHDFNQLRQRRWQLFPHRMAPRRSRRERQDRHLRPVV